MNNFVQRQDIEDVIAGLGPDLVERLDRVIEPLTPAAASLLEALTGTGET